MVGDIGNDVFTMLVRLLGCVNIFVKLFNVHDIKARRIGLA